MLDNEYTNSDLELRSLMEDAEVKPSRRVWKAVAARMGAGAASSAVIPVWMRWAVGCVAAAAAATLLVLRPASVSEPIPTQNHIDRTPVLAQNASNPVPASPVPAEAAEASSPLSWAVPVKEIPGRHESASAPVAGAMEERQETISSGSGAREESCKAARKADSPSGDGAVGKSAGSGMSWEEYVSKEERTWKRTRSIYAQSSVGGNDSGIRLSFGGTRMSAGVDSGPRAGITELGESVFGVPVSFGLGARVYVLPKFSVGAGVSYSILTRTFDGRYVNLAGHVDAEGSVKHQLHYLGIPVNMYYDIVGTERFKFYVYGGAEAEFCTVNKYQVHSGADYTYSSPVRNIQWSAGLGLGVEFKFNDFLGIYADPGVRYWFNCNQPRNIHTESPIMVNLDVGLRFEF